MLTRLRFLVSLQTHTQLIAPLRNRNSHSTICVVCVFFDLELVGLDWLGCRGRVCSLLADS